VQHAASAITAPDTDQLPAYWQFHEAVTRAQLTEWLPTGRHLLVDVSGPRGPGAELAAKAGHTVVRVLDGARQGRPPESVGPGRIVQVIADSSRLTFLGDGCADGIIADDRALSVHLAAEAMIAEIARVLRPAGRVIACVDSLVLGMALLGAAILNLWRLQPKEPRGLKLISGLYLMLFVAFTQRLASGISAVTTISPWRARSAIQSSAASIAEPAAMRSISGSCGIRMSWPATTLTGRRWRAATR